MADNIINIGNASGKALACNEIWLGTNNGDVQIEKAYIGDANGKAQLFYELLTSVGLGFHLPRYNYDSTYYDDAFYDLQTNTRTSNETSTSIWANICSSFNTSTTYYMDRSPNGKHSLMGNYKIKNLRNITQYVSGRAMAGSSTEYWWINDWTSLNTPSTTQCSRRNFTQWTNISGKAICQVSWLTDDLIGVFSFPISSGSGDSTLCSLNYLYISVYKYAGENTMPTYVKTITISTGSSVSGVAVYAGNISMSTNLKTLTVYVLTNNGYYKGIFRGSLDGGYTNILWSSPANDFYTFVSTSGDYILYKNIGTGYLSCELYNVSQGVATSVWVATNILNPQYAFFDEDAGVVYIVRSGGTVQSRSLTSNTLLGSASLGFTPIRAFKDTNGDIIALGDSGVAKMVRDANGVITSYTSIIPYSYSYHENYAMGLIIGADTL